VLALNLCGFGSDPINRTSYDCFPILCTTDCVSCALISSSSLGLRDRGKSLVIMFLMCSFVAWFAAQSHNRTTHGFASTELAWIYDDLGVAQGGHRAMARLPAPSMYQQLGVLTLFLHLLEIGLCMQE